MIVAATLPLAAATKNATALALSDLFQGGTTALTGLAAATVNLQLLAKIPRLAVAIDKITQGRATLGNGLGQGGQLAVAILFIIGHQGFAAEL